MAPLRPMMSAASSALNRVFTGTSTPPAVSNPNAAIIHSAELGAQTATRSPFSDAELGECACRATNPIDDLGEGEPQRAVDDRFRVAESVGRTQDHLGDGLPALLVRHTVTRRPRLPPMILA